MTQKARGSYFDKSERQETWSGIPVKTVYTPKDVRDIKYRRIADPGQYPFTRGIYEDMYRGRLWSRRQITGCSTPRLTNERLKYLISQGETAINVICDQPTQIQIDSDHPWAEGSVGRAGVPVTTMQDVWTIMDGIRLDETSTMLTAHSPLTLPSYLLLADHQGVPYSELRVTGVITPPTVSAPVCLYGGRERADQQGIPWTEVGTGGGDLLSSVQQKRMKEFADKLEFLIVNNCDKMYPANFNGYIIRETGVGAVEEVAWEFARAFEAFDILTRRGMDIDRIAPKVSFTFSAMIDLFEEIVKFRAARRVWARNLKERFGAAEPRSLQLKFHVNTAGVMMERQQPVINIVRAAYGALAAALGGTQSLQVAGYDEAIAIPTEEAATIGLRTQQILAYETGVTTVADPLGGSYYVESLTEKMDEEMQKVIDTIEEMGGMSTAVTSGYIDREMEKAWLKYQQEVEDKKRIVVGVNEFTIPEEEEADVEAYHHQVDFDLVNRYIEDLKGLKRTRSQAKARKALEDLRRAVETGDPEILRFEMECCKANCTTGEVAGVKRLGVGLPYDPM
ncbi:MAG: methylmalonyl-CoA mutase, partial [Anaerolineales bacterium]